MVEVARATEAITHLKIIRQNMESCYASTQSYMSCNWRDGIDDPNTMPNRHFQYSVPIAAQSLLRIEATRSTYELSVDDSANCTATCLGSFSTSPRSRIVLCVEQASGKIAMAGCGIYANIH